MGLAGWMNLQGEHEDDNGFEKTEKVDGRIVHEKASKHPGGTNEFTVVLGERFIVNAHGDGVDLSALKAAVGGLDLGKLEAPASRSAFRSSAAGPELPADGAGVQPLADEDELGARRRRRPTARRSAARCAGPARSRKPRRGSPAR